MSENSAENQVCKACGADVRPGALFCYSCGKSVEPDLLIANDEANRNGTSSFWFRGEIIEDKRQKELPELSETVQNLFEESAVGTAGKNVSIENKDRDVVKSQQTVLKTAASLRQRPKSLERKTVEIVWEAPENAPNFWFIAVSIILTLFAVGVLLAMLYIR